MKLYLIKFLKITWRIINKFTEYKHPYKGELQNIQKRVDKII